MTKYSVRFAGAFAGQHITTDSLAEAMDIYRSSNGMADVWCSTDGVAVVQVASGMDLITPKMFAR